MPVGQPLTVVQLASKLMNVILLVLMPPTNALALLEGFEGSVDVCTNIGECAPENADKKKCGTNTDCEDTTPGHFCKCSNGFAGVPTDKENGCENIDECGTNGDNNCHAWATCTDLVPLYSCSMAG